MSKSARQFVRREDQEERGEDGPDPTPSHDSADRQNETPEGATSHARVDRLSESTAPAQPGTVTHEPGPSQSDIAATYGVETVKHGQAAKIQRLEAEFGTDRVQRWVDEGMTIDAMGKPRDMRAFRERQEGRSDSVPTDIERHNQASVQRNRGASSETGPAGESGAPDAVRNVISSPGHSMDETVQREMESKMGGDFSDVQMHTGPEAAAAADSINARAFTVGNHVAFNDGEYDPGSDEGKEVLAHELTHVRQQTDGRVSMLPKADAAHPGLGFPVGSDVHVQPKLEVSSPDDPAEKEAEQVAEAVVDTDEGSASPSPGRDEINASPIGEVSRSPESGETASEEDLGTGWDNREETEYCWINLETDDRFDMYRWRVPQDEIPDDDPHPDELVRYKTDPSIGNHESFDEYFSYNPDSHPGVVESGLEPDGIDFGPWALIPPDFTIYRHPTFRLYKANGRDTVPIWILGGKNAVAVYLDGDEDRIVTRGHVERLSPFTEIMGRSVTGGAGREMRPGESYRMSAIINGSFDSAFEDELEEMLEEHKFSESESDAFLEAVGNGRVRDWANGRWGYTEGDILNLNFRNSMKKLVTVMTIQGLLSTVDEVREEEGRFEHRYHGENLESLKASAAGLMEDIDEGHWALLNKRAMASWFGHEVDNVEGEVESLEQYLQSDEFEEDLQQMHPEDRGEYIQEQLEILNLLGEASDVQQSTRETIGRLFKVESLDILTSGELDSARRREALEDVLVEGEGHDSYQETFNRVVGNSGMSASAIKKLNSGLDNLAGETVTVEGWEENIPLGEGAEEAKGFLGEMESTMLGGLAGTVTMLSMDWEFDDVESSIRTSGDLVSIVGNAPDMAAMLGISPSQTSRLGRAFSILGRYMGPAGDFISGIADAINAYNEFQLGDMGAAAGSGVMAAGGLAGGAMVLGGAIAGSTGWTGVGLIVGAALAVIGAAIGWIWGDSDDVRILREAGLIRTAPARNQREVYGTGRIEEGI